MLKELFSANPYIVINTDLDGFLCGMLLQKHFDCKIAGFSNSKESIWLDASLPDSFTVLSPVYIDMFVSDPKVVCIDQHVIGILILAVSAYRPARNARFSAKGLGVVPNFANFAS